MSEIEPLGGPRTPEDEKQFVMSTNNSSIVSKRSVEKLYLAQEEEEYLRHFVGKFHRRSPVINRGYWLRMRAIYNTVTTFMKVNRGKPKLIINLGCGYDTLAFRWLDNGDLHDDTDEGAFVPWGVTTFVDVDFPELIEKKVSILRQHDTFLAHLEDYDFNEPRHYGQPLLDSERYVALPCDLADPSELEFYLSHWATNRMSLLFIAEVSLTYMSTDLANKLISFASKYQTSYFCLLEQYLPDGEQNRFAETMLQHFKKLRSPLNSVHMYPSLDDQRRRFQNWGFPYVAVKNLWQVWADEDFVTAEDRADLDIVEAFDEWEEFALFASHYFLLIASGGCATPLNVMRDLRMSVRTSVPPNRATAAVPRLCLQMQYHQLPNQHAMRRFAASFAQGPDTYQHHQDNTNEKGCVYVHGGYGPKAKLDDWFCLSNMDIQYADDSVLCTSVPQVQLMCHTAVALDNGSVCIVGGRTSPSTSSRKVWWLIRNVWYNWPSQDLLNGVYRHSAVSVCTDPGAPGKSNAVLMFGGKKDESTIRGEFVLLSCTQTSPYVCQKLVLGRDKYKLPPRRFGACMFTEPTGEGTTGWLIGGIGEDGIVLKDIWRWKLLIDANDSYASTNCTGIECEDMTSKFWYKGCQHFEFSRFGAKAVRFGDRTLLIGGISRNGTIPYDQTILCVDGRNFTALKLPLITKGPRPLLVGFTADNFSNDSAIITGGGATCFSFGPFWNEGFYVLSREGCDRSKWVVNSLVGRSAARRNKRIVPIILNPSNSEAPTETIRRQEINEASDFEAIVAAGVPVIIEDLELGSCRSWTLQDLRSKIGVNTQVTTHTSQSQNMSFLDKNFTYTRETCDAFFDSIERGAPKYLRAVSTSDPSKKATSLAADFPGLAEDFVLPAQLELVKQNEHSSPLRISGPVSMWLHYDVMANVLCQIYGTKRLLLYHPRNVGRLEIPPGASSSRLSPLSQSNAIPGVTAYEARLSPGDVLYIPPLWPHTATPTDGVSVAVNVFFQSFSSKHYAAGRDVYGNRDLQVYETGRRDVKRIMDSVKNLPGDARSFYLKRLALELSEAADN